MSIKVDLETLKARLNELKRTTPTKDSVLWKPVEGENKIRIVPRKEDPSNPFIELYFHYLGSKTYLSPLSFGEADPISEFAEALRAGGNLPKDEWIETKKFDAVRRTYVPVIDRNKPQNGVRYWAFGKTIYEDLLTIMTDLDEYGYIADPQTGRDLNVTFTPREKSDTNFAKTSFKVSVKQTPLTTNADELKLWLNEQPDLLSLYPRLSYEQLKDVLDKFIDVSAASTESTTKTEDGWANDESVNSPSAEKSAKHVSANKKTVDVEKEFEDIFNG